MMTSMTTPLQTNPAVDHYLQEHARVVKTLAAQQTTWVKQLRQNALTQFAEQGFPTPANEEWKYTNVAPLLKHAFIRSPQLTKENLSLPGLLPAELACYRLVFIDGYFAPQFSILATTEQQNLHIANLAHILSQQPNLLEEKLGKFADDSASSFTALNTAFLHDGAYIRVPKNTILTKPIHLLFVSTEQASANFVRNFIALEENSQATIIQSSVSATAQHHFSNIVTELMLEEKAHCNHYQLLQENDRAFHINTLQVQQRQQSYFNSYSFALSGGLTRSDINVTLADEHTECSLQGLYLGQGKQHIDHHTLINHVKPYGTSRENYKGILADRSRAVFNGKVIVQPGAQKTDAQQSNKNLLLSNDAEIDTKPQLEIYNDDVRCTHGATVGQLDETSLFYLRSRGIDTKTARSILIQAFAREILDGISLAPLKQQLENYLNNIDFVAST